MNLFNVGKQLIEKHPKWLGIASKIYSSISFNKIKIHGKNNTLTRRNVFMKKCKIKIIGNNNCIEIGDMSYLQNTSIAIYGDNSKIVHGKKVFVSNGNFYLEDNNNSLEIGNKTTFSGNTHLAVTEGKKITIGENCLFSSNVVFRTRDSHSILDLQQERINYGKDIIIEDHVWFTQNVTLLKGAKISRDSVVATGSIVTKEFEKGNVILGGNPAKVIKQGINWCHERRE